MHGKTKFEKEIGNTTFKDYVSIQQNGVMQQLQQQ